MLEIHGFWYALFTFCTENANFMCFSAYFLWWSNGLLLPYSTNMKDFACMLLAGPEETAAQCGRWCMGDDGFLLL